MKERSNTDLEWVPYDLDNDYFQWLCDLIDAYDERRSYIYLMRKLFETEFSNETADLIPNDDNRIEDGLALREDFVEEIKAKDHLILCGPCSLLEMIIGLSFRIENIIGSYDYITWFWEMIGNLELLEYDDGNHIWKERRMTNVIDDIVYILLRREYSRDGDGSLFPLNRAKQNMRNVEIWYQMNNYLIERYMD